MLLLCQVGPNRAPDGPQALGQKVLDRTYAKDGTWSWAWAMRHRTWVCASVGANRRNSRKCRAARCRARSASALDLHLHTRTAIYVQRRDRRCALSSQTCWRAGSAAAAFLSFLTCFDGGGPRCRRSSIRSTQAQGDLRASDPCLDFCCCRVLDSLRTAKRSRERKSALRLGNRRRVWDWAPPRAAR